MNMESDIYSLEDLEGKTIAVQTTTRPEKIFLSKTDERIPRSSFLSNATPSPTVSNGSSRILNLIL